MFDNLSTDLMSRNGVGALVIKPLHQQEVEQNWLCLYPSSSPAIRERALNIRTEKNRHVHLPYSNAQKSIHRWLHFTLNTTR